MAHHNQRPSPSTSRRAASRRAIFIVCVSLLFGAVATIEDVPQIATPSPAEPPVASGESLTFEATAYCRMRNTSLGTRSRAGMAAADADLLPMGSVIRVARSGGYDGIYTVMHDRPSLEGRAIDLYLRDCGEAEDFGQQNVRLEILRLGWQPRLDS